MSVDLLEMLQKHGKLRIPRIQRAYAQGRSEERLIRESFLDSIFDALEHGNVLEINFVYGSNSSNAFDILDGQQRITTLALLYWYCANAELSEIPQALKGLCYETRPSSSDFMQDLVARKINFLTKIPSQAISGMRWFSYAYSCDPTIVSMLGMLDAIHRHYNDIKEKISSPTEFSLYNKLNLLRFYEHSLDGYSRTDELYIKMNARGLPLAPFENFKADLDGWLRKRNEPMFVRCVSLGDREMRWWQAFLAKIDTTWTSYFWRKGDNSRAADYELNQRLFRLFIRYILARYITAGANDSAQALADDEVVKFLDDSDQGAESQKEVYLRFDKFGLALEKSPEALFGLDALMDKLIERNLNIETLDSLIKNPYTVSQPSWIADKKDIKRPQMAAFAAIMAFLNQVEVYNEIEFKKWLRVVWNVVNNYNIDNLPRQIQVVRGLINLLNKPGMVSDVYGTMASVNPEGQINPIQEELLKARLIVQSDEARSEWEAAIREAELKPFFAGMIGFYIQDGIALEQFKHRANNASSLFDTNGIREEFREGHILLRAMLSQVRNWNNGIGNLIISENANTKDKYLKNFLASREPVRAFFRQMTELEGVEQMRAMMVQACSQSQAFGVNEVGVGDSSYAQSAYSRLVTDPRIWEWAARTESEKHKSPVIELRYGHYMLNFQRLWSSRILLDTEREKIAQRLVEDYGFEIAAQEQRDALQNFGYFTDCNIDLIKNVEGGKCAVAFRTDHCCHITAPDMTVRVFNHGLLAGFKDAFDYIEEILSVVVEEV